MADLRESPSMSGASYIRSSVFGRNDCCFRSLPDASSPPDAQDPPEGPDRAGGPQSSGTPGGKGTRPERAPAPTTRDSRRARNS